MTIAVEELVRPAQATLPTEFGFRSGPRGMHTSRTMMFAELERMLRAVPAGAPPAEYRRAAVEDNVLAKTTAASRLLTAKRLSELYGLDPSIPIFRVLRRLWMVDARDRPMLAILCACARDPLLRLTAPAVLRASHGQRLSSVDLDAALLGPTEGRLSAATRNKVARNALATWTQAGHLSGRQNKIRQPPAVGVAATTYALLLAYLAGARGRRLLTSFWGRLLDIPEDSIVRLAMDASRKALMDFRYAGGVVEVRFRDLLTRTEQEACHESG